MLHRDLGEYIRSGVAAAFRGGSDEPRDTERCEEIYTRLSNISGNRYKEAFYVTVASSASGLLIFVELMLTSVVQYKSNNLCDCR